MSYELEADYGDGLRDGADFAEYHFDMWQDAKGPPFPWPTSVSRIEFFINLCLPMMRTVLQRKLSDDARENGIDTSDLVIPQDFKRGVDDGYRTTLTNKLVNFINQR